MEKVRRIPIDAGKKTGENTRAPLRCVSAARAGLLLRKDHQDHLRRAVKECGFQYLRFHGLFQEDLGVYRENAGGEAVYSWLYADAVYDFLMEIGLRPFVVLDFMPEALAGGKKTVYWEKANVSVPLSYEKWGALVYETVKHFEERYGREEVAQWYFEVWNEPDNPPFFSGSFPDYCRLYQEAAFAVKKVCPEFRVGGPAISGQTAWVEGLIRHCWENHVPLDFISAHNYASRPFREDAPSAPPAAGTPAWNPGPSWPLGNHRYDPEGLAPSVSAVRQAVARSPMPHLQIHYTEWGLTWDYWDPLRDSYQAASYLLSRLHAAGEGAESFSYCEVSDIFEEDGPPTGEFHGGFGLLNAHGIRKPAYWAYRFLAGLGKERLECGDPEAIACAENGAVQLLFWDSSARQDAENKEYFGKEVPALPAGRVQAFVTGLQPGRYLATTYSVGYQRNDPFTMYLNMNRGGSLTREQVGLLEEISSGRPFAEEFIKVENEKSPVVVFDREIRENDVYFISIRPY